MIVYFAGRNTSYSEMLKSVGVNYRLEAFTDLKDEPPSPEFITIIDSGGFAVRTRGIELKVQDYANYLNRYKIPYAFNLDTLSVEESHKNQAFLEENTNTYILPVYHLSEWIRKDYKTLEVMCSKYPFIAIGGVASVTTSRPLQKAFLNFVFSLTRDKVRVHGLGITAQWELELYPFYSVDSTTWMNGAKYGEFAYFDGCKLKKHVSRKITARGKRTIKHAGIMGSLEEMLKASAIAHIKLQTHITAVWEARGVRWELFEDYLKTHEKYKINFL